MSIKNVDDLLIKSQQSKDVKQDSGNNAPDPESYRMSHSKEEKPQDIVEKPIEEEEKSHETEEYVDESAGEVSASESSDKTEVKPSEKVSEGSHSTDDNLDEYGTNVKKESRMYTEEEVQYMIKDRLSRMKTQPTQEVKRDVQDFKVDPENPDSWEVQLDNFINNSIERRERKVNERAWQEQELSRQQEFETKFTTGAKKYPDFERVVERMPLTDAMMQATMSMKDPAAFIYNASKNHAERLRQISQIRHPIDQATEIGKLHVEMIKAKNITKAHKPIVNRPQSDVMPAYVPKRSIDERIAEHAKNKRKR